MLYLKLPFLAFGFHQSIFHACAVAIPWFAVQFFLAHFQMACLHVILPKMDVFQLYWQSGACMPIHQDVRTTFDLVADDGVGG